MNNTDTFFCESKNLISKNLERIRGIQQVKSDNELLYNSDMSSLSEHNYQYTLLLCAYVQDFLENSAKKRKHKEDMFQIAKEMLRYVPVATLCFAVVTLICLVYDTIDALEAMPGVCVALSTLLGTFMVIPKMITKYLFNKREEEHLKEIIGKIQEYDRNIREHSQRGLS